MGIDKIEGQPENPKVDYTESTEASQESTRTETTKQMEKSSLKKMGAKEKDVKVEDARTPEIPPSAPIPPTVQVDLQKTEKTKQVYQEITKTIDLNNEMSEAYLEAIDNAIDTGEDFAIPEETLEGLSQEDRQDLTDKTDELNTMLRRERNTWDDAATIAYVKQLLLEHQLIQNKNRAIESKINIVTQEHATKQTNVVKESKITQGELRKKELLTEVASSASKAVVSGIAATATMGAGTVAETQMMNKSKSLNNEINTLNGQINNEVPGSDAFVAATNQRDAKQVVLDRIMEAGPQIQTTTHIVQHMSTGAESAVGVVGSSARTAITTERAREEGMETQLQTQIRQIQDEGSRAGQSADGSTQLNDAINDLIIRSTESGLRSLEERR